MLEGAIYIYQECLGRRGKNFGGCSEVLGSMDACIEKLKVCVTEKS